MIQSVLIIKYNSTLNIIRYLQYDELFHVQPFFLLSAITTYFQYNIAHHTACLYRMKQYRIYLKHSYSSILAQPENLSYNCYKTIYFSVGDNKI